MPPPDRQGPADMDIKRLLKVYNYVNDESRPKVNLKFAAMALAFLAVAVALFSFSALGPRDSGPEPAATEQTEYVGMTPSEAALQGSDFDVIQSRYSDWRMEHPEAEILAMDPHYDSMGRWTGYDITYRE